MTTESPAGTGTTTSTGPVQDVGLWSVAQLLKESGLCIPEYQRGYTWTAQDVEALINDVETFTRGDREYRLGTVILHEHPAEADARGDAAATPREPVRDLVDGQQRYLTLAVIDHVIERELERHDRDRSEHDLPGPASQSLPLALTWTPSEQSRAALSAAYDAARRVLGMGDGGPARAQDLVDLRRRLRERCTVIVLTTTDLDTAFLMFDSQNTRGKALHPVDLLKAHHLRAWRDAPGAAPTEPELIEAVRDWEDEPELVEHVIADVLHPVRRWTRGEWAETGRFGLEDARRLMGARPTGAPLRWERRSRAAFEAWRDQDAERVDDDAAPFTVTDTVLAGEPFLAWVAHYVEQARRLGVIVDLWGEGAGADGIEGTGTDAGRTGADTRLGELLEVVGHHRWRSGDHHLRRLLDCLLLAYVDRFGWGPDARIEVAAARLAHHVWLLRRRYTRIATDTTRLHALGGSPRLESRRTNLFALMAGATGPDAVLALPWIDEESRPDDGVPDPDPLADVVVFRPSEQRTGAGTSPGDGSRQARGSRAGARPHRGSPSPAVVAVDDGESDGSRSSVSARPALITIQELLQANRFRIPLYQRPYAWGREEILTLLTDVAAATEHGGSDYYLGPITLAASTAPRTPAGGAGARPETDRDVRPWLEVVDGQQRLTTLVLALALCGGGGEAEGRDAAVLHLDARPADNELLESLLRAPTAQERRSLVADGAGASAAVGAADDAHRATPHRTLLGAARLLEHECAGGLLTPALATALMTRVRVLRHVLPERTDLNHYFEVMNTRGEQLQPHEILKARLMGELRSPADRALMDEAWEACAGDRPLDRFLTAHHGPFFEASHPEAFLRDPVAAFAGAPDAAPGTVGSALREGLRDVLDTIASGSPDRQDRAEQAVPAPAPVGADADGHEDAGPARTVRLVLDMPNLLLHALALERRTGAAHRAQGAQPTPLDDKRLLTAFHDAAARSPLAPEDFTRDVVVRLLRARYLLEHVVIRRPGSTEADAADVTGLAPGWSLGSADEAGAGRVCRHDPLLVRAAAEHGEGAAGTLDRLLMLEAMLEATYPQRASKRYLSRLLRAADQQLDGSGLDAEGLVEELERFVAEELPAAGSPSLDGGTGVPHLVLNALDYLLWRRAVEQPGEIDELAPRGEDGTSPAGGLPAWADTATFSVGRTSIEHFYPQHPDPDTAPPDAGEGVAPEDRDLLGNLALMSTSSNSRFSNLLPAAKIAQAERTMGAQSLKLRLMAAIAGSEGTGWNGDAVRDHSERMKRVLEDFIDEVTDRRTGAAR